MIGTYKNINSFPCNGKLDYFVNIYYDVTYTTLLRPELRCTNLSNIQLSKTSTFMYHILLLKIFLMRTDSPGVYIFSHSLW